MRTRSVRVAERAGHPPLRSRYGASAQAPIESAYETADRRRAWAAAEARRTDAPNSTLTRLWLTLRERMRCPKGDTRRAKLCRKVARLSANAVIVMLSARLKDSVFGDDPKLRYLLVGGLMIVLASEVLEEDQCAHIGQRFPTLARVCRAAVPALQRIVHETLAEVKLV